MRSCSALLLLYCYEDRAVLDLIALCDAELRYCAGPRRCDAVLHLHRFEDEEQLAALDAITFGDQHRRDGAGHGRGESLIDVAPRRRGEARLLSKLEVALRAVEEAAILIGDHRKRIA